MAGIPRHIVEQTHDYMREILERAERRRLAALGGAACNESGQNIAERIRPAEITDLQNSTIALSVERPTTVGLPTLQELEG